MNWFAFLAAVICALIALAYAIPSLALAAVMRAFTRRTGMRLPVGLIGFIRLPWAPVLLWGTAALIFLYIALGG